MNDWLTLEEASEYLKIGKTSLYDLAQSGKLPSNKLGKKWLFNKALLDAWVRSSMPIGSFFTSVDAFIDENPQIREPQREAYEELYSYFKSGKEKAIVQIPVGCGKSGLAAIIPFGIARGRVLVVAPNLTIKDGLFETFDINNRQKCFWRKRKVLDDANMLAGPSACTLDTGNVSVCEESHIVITNVQQLATNLDKWLLKFSDDFFDLIIIDEAHHSAANSWKRVLEKFSSAKVVNLTATPFRSDGQEIEGELVYRYSFRRATMSGYIKRVKAWYVAPLKLTFTAKGETRDYSLNEVLAMKEHDWFSRGIALSEVCNEHIVDNSLEKLETLRETGTQHQLIAVACSVDHAKSIRSMYSERGYSADVIHSKMDEDKKADVMRRLKNGDLDCIVQVQMLGEGFDHPKLSVAAIFRPFRTLTPYIQFVGRILRVVVQNDPVHPDNYGHIVTHSGMNLQDRLQEFQLFEKDDQKFWENVISGNDPEPSREVKEGEARMRTSELAFADNEIVESLIGEDFITTDDEDLIRDLEKKLELLGIDPKHAKELVLTRAQKQTITESAEPFHITPQREWNEKRKRLNETVNRKASILLNRLNLKRGGRELVKAGVYANNNFIAAVVLINKEIKKRHTKPRDEWDLKELRTASGEVDEIVNNLTRAYKAKGV